jgi:methylated-DNA-[protein]-cysteine S-methyltransferase
MNAYHETFDTCFGPFSVATDAAGAVLATAFGDTAALRRRLGPADLAVDPSRTRAARDQVLAYCAGDRRHFTLPLAAHGTAFQQRVWAGLSTIPCGETRSYRQLAVELGRPRASRAVGRANATNPICLVVPCHRVIGSDGSLTGFAFGETLKRRLLEHERALAPRARAA